MDTKEVFDKIGKLKSLEAALKGVKPQADNPDVSQYNKLIKELEEYCSNFDIKKLFQLYDHAQNEKHFAVQYNLHIQDNDS